VFIPLATALILVNGVSASSILVCAGVLAIAAGLVYRIPFPVQPLKALAAVAIAQGLAAQVIFAASIEMGACLLILSLGGFATWLSRAFTKPVVRALQLGVGVLLIVSAWRLVARPPDVFVTSPSTPVAAVLAVGTFGGAWVAGRFHRYWIAIGLLAAGIAASLLVAAPEITTPELSLPNVAIPPASAFATAFVLLVVPQLPLTFGNAVVAVNDLAHEEFQELATHVSPSRICITDGTANVITGILGGMPMCHGAGGLTAHIKLGARTAGMNLLLGGTFLVLGLFWAADVPQILGLLPVWVLGGFLAYAGLRHAMLAADLRGASLTIAVVAAAAGVWTANLAITAGLALVAVHAPRFLRLLRPSPDTL
jgi:hypothetical protein